MLKNFFNQSIGQVCRHFDTDLEKGLSSKNASKLLDTFGPNEIKSAERKSLIVMFLQQFKNPLLIILMIGAAISFFTGHTVDGIAIVVIVFINAGISFYQEFKAEKSMEALRAMSAPQAVVKRDGNWTKIPASDIVPGDILKIETGDILAADVRLAEAHRLQTDESALTGESEPVNKHTDTLDGTEVDLGDRFNMGFMSTVVTMGNGTGVVVETGMKTEVGHIAELLATAEEPKTPLQQRIESLSHVMIGAAFTVVAIVIGIGIHHGMDLLEMLNTGISLSVAGIPEGLPTVVTIVLTMGSQRMARGNALARKLDAVETLGATSVSCSDKTGTLTQNQMQVMGIWAGGKQWSLTGRGFDPDGKYLDHNGVESDPKNDPDLTQVLTVSVLCNDAQLLEKEGRWTVQGNPTEGALLVAAAKAAMGKENIEAGGYDIIQRFPFDSTRKMMSIIVKDPSGGYLLMAKGAPDVVLDKTVSIRIDSTDKGKTAETAAIVENAIENFGKSAYRTLAIAVRQLAEGQLSLEPEDLEKDFLLIGIHGIIDPPRPEVLDSISQCSKAGIRTVMITGDHAVTAKAIAEQTGIISREKDMVLTGAQLNQTASEELTRKAPEVAVFARVSPEHKLKIVDALQANDQVVAMTGDGVNDAPALRKADIGVAMGITGTSVAKEAAALVLLDDNFSTIVTAVREGRRIFDNIKKFIRQELTANVAEVSVILFAFLMMGDDPLLPLTALMVLWINLVSDGLPALALGVEPAEGDLMERMPRDKNEKFFNREFSARIIIRGLCLGWLSYFIFDYALKQNSSLPYAQTLAFSTMVFGQLWHAFDSRTFTSLFSKNPFTNPYLLLAVGLSAILSLGAIYTPLGQVVLGTETLTAKHLLMVIAISSLPTFFLSGIKEIFGIKFL